MADSFMVKVCASIPLPVFTLINADASLGTISPRISNSSRGEFTPALRAALQTIRRARNENLSVQEPARGGSWSVRRRTDGRRDGDIPVTQAAPGRNRSSTGMDCRKSPAPCEVRGFVPSQTVTNYSIRKSLLGIVRRPACNSGTFLA
jgi:hypothetical protein